MKQLFRGEKAVPDHLRCHRSDGRHWQCPRRAISDYKFCEHHHLQLRRNQEKAAASASASSKIKMEEDRPSDRPSRKRRRRREAALPMEELIGMALRRQMERREERERSRRRGAEVKRDLPNGMMAISAAIPRKGFDFDNAGPPVDRKLGFDAGCFLRRCFRSKNAEPLPVGSFQKFTCGSRGLERRVCHICGEEVCWNSFCTSCIKKCNYCKVSIADLHRRCSKCSYKLCIRCCRVICGRSLPKGVAIVTYNYPNKRRKSYKHVGMKHRHASLSTTSSMLHEVEVKNGDVSISCPSKEIGGCGDGILNLSFILPLGWTPKLDTNAEQIACDYDDDTHSLQGFWVMAPDSSGSTGIKGRLDC